MLRPQCCNKSCVSKLSDDVVIQGLRKSFDAMDNDEKNTSLMSILKQASKDGKGWLKSCFCLTNHGCWLSYFSSVCLGWPSNSPSHPRGDVVKEGGSHQIYKLKDHVVCKQAFCQLLNINVKRVAWTH